jgi:hypothetical protein
MVPSALAGAVLGTQFAIKWLRLRQYRGYLHRSLQSLPLSSYSRKTINQYPAIFAVTDLENKIWVIREKRRFMKAETISSGLPVRSNAAAVPLP